MTGARPPVSAVKIGGSLVSDRTRLLAVLASLAEGSDGPAVIVPGGGPFADAVRSAQAALGFGDALAHRLALDAMGRMAEICSELEPRLGIARSLSDAETAVADGRTCLWDPVALRDGHPDIAESWDVSSDSLALWLARRLGAARCVLVKSAPCPPGADPAALARRGFVDNAFPGFACAFAGAIVVRSPGSERVLKRLSSHPHPHPEARGGAEPRRRPPEGAEGPGGRLRGPLARAPQDEGGGGIAVWSRPLS